MLKAVAALIIFNYKYHQYLLCERVLYEENQKFFGFSALLSTEAEPEKAVYGGHPNGEGGTVVADAFVKQFGSLFE